MRTYLGVVIGILVLGIVLGAVTQASDVSGTVRFFISENETTNSLGIVVVGGSPTGIHGATVIVQASNCTTSGGSMSCVPVAGATMNVTIIRPNNFTSFLILNGMGNGNHTIFIDFFQAGNYTLNFSARHPIIGTASLLAIFPVTGFFQTYGSNVNTFENRTFFGGYNLSYAQFNSTMSQFMNVTVTNRYSNITVNISLFLNASIPRPMMTFPDDSLVSPSSAEFIARYIDPSGKRNILILNETNASLAGRQEVMFVLNGTIVTINISILTNATRDVAYLSDHGFIVTPQSAAVSNLSFADNLLNFSANGSGNQEVLLYIGDSSEPSFIIIDNSTVLTNSNWTFNSSAGTLAFNYTFSAHEFSVSFPTPIAEEEAPGQSGSAPSGGGGGGSSTIPVAKPNLDFTVSPPVLRTSLFQDSTKELKLNIHNTGGKTQTFTVTTDSREIVTIPEETFDLEPNEIKSIAIQVYASETRPPDSYTRKIFVSNGEKIQTVNIIIDVKPLKPLFDIELEILPEYKTIERDNSDTSQIAPKFGEVIEGDAVQTGDNILFKVKFTNLGTLKNASIPIEITATHLESNVTYRRLISTEYVETQLSIIKVIRIPKSAPEGLYAITMKAVIEGQTIVATDILNVRSQGSEAFALPDISGLLIPLMIIIALMLGGIVAYTHFIHRKLDERRKAKQQKKEPEQVKIRTEGWTKPGPLSVQMKVVYPKGDERSYGTLGSSESVKVSVSESRGWKENAVKNVRTIMKGKIKSLKRESGHLDIGFKKGVIDEVGYYKTKARLAERMNNLRRIMKGKSLK